jgi:YgiT-type zinc finger domain-containing protein
MKCVICKNGETEAGLTTITLEREGTVIVVKLVPANICSNCGEVYLDDETSSVLLKKAEEASQAGVQVDVRSYSEQRSHL